MTVDTQNGYLSISRSCFNPAGDPDMLTAVANHSNERSIVVANHLTMRQAILVYMVPVAGLISQ